MLYLLIDHHTNGAAAALVASILERDAHRLTATTR